MGRLRGGLLFALHPLQVEAVAWITGLKDLLCGLLSMAALWEYVLFARAETIKARSNEHDAKRQKFFKRQGHYLIAILWLAAAILAKPSAVTVPLIAGTIDWLIFKRAWRQVLMAMIPLCVVSLVFIVAEAHVQPASAQIATPLWSRPLIGAYALAFYILKLLVPIRLSAVYPLSFRQVLGGHMIWVAWLLPATVAGLAWRLRRSAPWFAAAFVMFVAAALPVLGLLQFGYERYSIVADRYVYMAMLGPAIALAFGLARLNVRSPLLVRRVVVPGVIAALAVLATLSAIQEQYWHDTRSLFTRVLKIDPNSAVAYTDLAGDAMDHGNLAEAEQLAREAVRLDPSHVSYRVMLGTILLKLNRQSEAVKEFFQVYRLDPRNPVALTNLAADLERRGRLNDAIFICRGAVRSDPEYPEAHRTLAILLFKHNEIHEALKEAAEAVRLDPYNVPNHVVYGNLLASSGQQESGEQQFTAARSIDPNSVQVSSGGIENHSK